MIEQKQVEAALEYMRKHARDLASAKANRIYITHYLKTCFANLYQECEEKTVEGKKNWAYSQPDYHKQLQALQIAVQEEETHKWKMAAAEALVEVWRTQCANDRLTDRSHQ
jgi:hypothetical protein